MPLPRPRRWDRRWRIIIFDIPEKKKNVRDRVRALVQRLGFFRLQHSVWVYPYDCEEIITLLKSDLKLGSQLLYMIVDAIEYDKPIREHFDLPLDR
ncbi:CRISPR-associated endonuclease Cas2 [Candidatus Kaiserbacteria bacterium]|nr:CRISPR-associated endonuclease Cas2 [Candidatus Kaiserbacteria bacterium]